MTAYWCEHAVLGDGAVAAGVLVDVSGDTITSVTRDAPVGTAHRLLGLTIPGFANCHSHAFHRALRARTQHERGSFWTWREQMYALASRLEPDSYYDVALAVYREMAAAGFTTVGEFHYLHHTLDGSAYDDPNAMGHAVIAAAREVGVRLTLLDACYLTAGIGTDVAGVQRRFSDRTVAAWQERVSALTSSAGRSVVVGAAAHSVRAVPQSALGAITATAAAHAMPLHVHLSEQVAENEACQAAYGCSPTELLSDAGLLGASTTAVHATHLSARDIELLAGSATVTCLCPTTERDLGDGIGPARALFEAGSPLTVGSDSCAVIDPFEELRAVELDERLASQQRGHFAASELFAAGTTTGHAALGFPDAGRIEVGARADLVTVDLGTPRTGGGRADLETVVFAATGADVVHVVCDGKVVATRDESPGIGRQLAAALARAWGEA